MLSNNEMNIYCLIFYTKIAVQDERGPRKRKTITIRQIEILSSSATASSLPRPPQCATNNFHIEILTQILMGCIEQAKENDGFRMLSRQQQNVILSKVWCECFVLRASHWSIDITSIIEKCNDSALKSLIDETRTLNADLIELSLLETMILCRKGFCGSHAKVFIERLN